MQNLKYKALSIAMAVIDRRIAGSVFIYRIRKR